MDNLLNWLSPQIQRTLKQLMATVLVMPDSHAAPTTALDAEQTSLRSLIGALELASQGQTSIGVVLTQLKAVLGHWQSSQNTVAGDERQVFLHTCQSLLEFDQANLQHSDYSELSLYAAYSALCQLDGTPPHPSDLWPLRLRHATASAAIDPEVLARLCAQASQRAAHVSIDERQRCEQGLHTHVLTLLRSLDGRTSEVRQSLQALQLLADAWLLDAREQPTRVAIMGLFRGVLSAYAAGSLAMDVWLKRLFLCILSRFQTDEAEHLLHLSFYSYLAWQQAAGAAPLGDQGLGYPPRLIELAHWKALKGAHYDVAIFGRTSPRTMDELLGQLERTKSALASFSAEAQVTPESAVPLATAIQHLSSLLVAFQPSAESLTYELGRAMAQPKLPLGKRAVQIELATTLLVLEAMLGYPSAQNHSDFELRFSELARRLRCAQEDQPVGVFAPWMFELQHSHAWHKTNEQLVGEVKSRLSTMEQAFLQRDFASLDRQVASLGSIAKSMKWDALAATAQSMALQLRQGLGAQDEAKFASNLAAMGLFTDMQAQSRHSAQTLFSFDEHSSQLVMKNPLNPTAASPVVAQSAEVTEMQQFFLEEAAELLATAKAVHADLTTNPADTEQIVVLRRTFHTLKGGARMVDMPEFAQIAWHEERQLNQLLADKMPLSTEILNANESALAQLATYIPQSSIQFEPPPQLVPNLAISQPQDWLDLPATKVIGDLTISLALYNAYLNEADEWSRQLVTALSEWRIDSSLPLPAMTLTWAHALAGSSATVGFVGLSQLAKSMEHVIERVHETHFQHPDLAPTLELAANDVCRLLHQFAAGFIKEPSAQLLSQLSQLQLADSVAPAVPLLAPSTETVNEAEPPSTASPDTAIDADLIAIFAEESSVLVPQLGASMRMWLHNSGDGVPLEQRAEALRVLHTLKGSARLVGQMGLAQKAHDLESAIESYADSPSAAQRESLLVQYDQLSGQNTPALSKPELNIAPASSALPPAVAKVASLTPSPSFTAIPSGEVIRVKLGLIDRLVNQSGEILIARARLEAEVQRAQHSLTDMTTQVARLRDQLRELEVQTESQMQSRQAQFSDQALGFDPLELDRFTRTQELTRFMAEALSDISTFQRGLQRSLNATEDDLAAQSRLAKDLQRNLLRTRMVPFDSLAERLHRLVRMTSQELGKSVELTITGGVQELDRSVLERVTPAFEHLLRNAIVHGIEAPSERERLGKTAQGQIRISMTQNGNDVWVTVNDDGQGLNEKAVRNRAMDLDPAAATQSDAAQLIFMTGLSTAPNVSELAGRGIGMDVVRAQVLALGGRIEVQSQAELGTSFKLILPLTTAVTQIVLVRTGTHVTALPANLIQTVLRTKREQTDTALQSHTWVIGQTTCPFYTLDELLQYPKSEPYQSGVVPIPPSVLLLSSAGQTLAVCVDEVLGNQEAVVKNLGPQLAQMPGLAGMTVLPTGQTVLIYNPVALATVYGTKVIASAHLDPQMPRVQENAAAPVLAPLVMVVDDSITMRRVLQRLLVREGYRTTQAADGKQALDMLRVERPTLVLSDVEMPRMDGFELLKQIRTSEKLQDLPVVMITSRIADKHRDHAKSLGANEYLGKPYPEEELIALLRKYAPV